VVLHARAAPGARQQKSKQALLRFARAAGRE
jgi:hypothetical protein